MTGYRGSDNTLSASTQVCSHQFHYLPSTNVGVQQQAFSGLIGDCGALQFVVVTFVPPGGLSATSPALALVIDDVVTTQRGCVKS